jgi:SNF2 family DNA or RNA helicase
LKSIRDGTRVPLLDAPESFKGTLRPYQQRGLSWLSFLVERGFGGCLADDMGLGKTVQVLALIAHRRRAAKKKLPPELVVCPTAVVINWSREAKRFVPELKVYVHQGAGRATEPAAFKAKTEGADLVVTSYALIRRDRELFEKATWDVVAADEAHNLKNPSALQTRALKALPSDRRVALTGTPVENHLTDLWSIYDFTMPGLLGGTTRFARTFTTPLRRGDTKAMERLQKRVGPFLLRRTKEDPGIAADLPPKQEQETWCDLTREQVALYQAMTEATVEGIEDKKGIHRRAHILAALLRFKQICNHPENFKTERPDDLFSRSGKLDRLMELVEELVMESQATLIFTQFTEMGRIIQRAIYDRMSLEVDFYHGGLTAKEREEIVEWFNDPAGPPVLIVSLKAGGTGLNLTRASAVIHYDRWWNPAVEDQATDRAHRIGQTRKVNVYKFVTRGTLEERIMNLLEAKRELAEQVLGSSDESWITEMNNQELRDFLALGSTTSEESDDAT